MDVSFVIVNWNTKDLTLKCIRSIIATKSAYSQEIIVVDNASGDGSVDAIKNEYPSVTVLSNGINLGFAKANNMGIERSTGRYICLVNSDVEVFADTVSFIIGYMESNLGVGIVGPRILFPDLTLQNSCRKYPNLWTKFCETAALNRIFPKTAIFSGEHMTHFAHDRFKKLESMAGCFMLIRREALSNVGLFDEQYFIYSEETDLCKRMNAAGWGIVFLPEVSVIHHHGASSSQDPQRFSIEQQKSLMKYWRKHHSFSSLACLFLLLLMHHSIRYALLSMRQTRTSEEKVAALRRIEKHRESLKELFTPGSLGKNK
jgi:GT2 family glycosyltransferase